MKKLDPAEWIHVYFVFGDRTHMMSPSGPEKIACGLHLNRPYTTVHDNDEPIWPVCDNCRFVIERRAELEA
jgi:hypothetical protein